MPAPDMLAYYLQRNAVKAPETDLSWISQGLGDMFKTMQANSDRQAANDEKKRAAERQAAADKAAAAKAQRDQDASALKLMQEQGKRYLAAGQNESAAKLSRDMQPINQRLGLPVGPGIVGGGTGVYDRETQQEMRTFDGDATTRALEGIFGPAPTDKLSPGQSLTRNGQIIVTAPNPRVVGTDRTGRSIVDLTSGIGGGGFPAAAPGGAPAAGRPTMVTAPVAPAARGGGGRRSSGGGSSSSTAPASNIVPGTQNAKGKGGLRLDDPRVMERIDKGAAAVREAALRRQPMVPGFNMQTLKMEPMHADPPAAKYQADLAEWKLRTQWGQKLPKPTPPAPYTHQKPAKVSSAVDEILSAYGLGEA